MASRYETEGYDPPAAVAKVVARNSDAARQVTGLRMLIDSGAAMSVLPKRAADSLGLVPVENQFLRIEGYDGASRRASTVKARIEFQDFDFTIEAEFVVVDGIDDGYIGRDILNHLTLRLDGKRLEWDVSS